MRLAFSGILLGALLAACNSMTGACTLELGTRASPRDTTIRVGQSFTPSFQFVGCGGRRVLEDSLSFRSSDSTVIAVDNFTGRTTARNQGSATILVTGALYGGPFPISVSVLP